MSLQSLRPGTRWPALLLVVLVATLSLSACTNPFDHGSSYTFQGGEIDSATAAPALSLTDQNGQPFSLDQQRGKAVLLYFGYTHCPDYCPTTLSDFVSVKQDLGEKADDVRFVLVTVDPDRDTPSRMAEYLKFFDPSFIGLSGSDDQLAGVERAYGIFAQKQSSSSALGYLVSHSTQVFVIDPDGKLRLTYDYGTDPAIIAQDLTHLV